jgi:sorbitol/mannitol transport system substrate-binding protein
MYASPFYGESSFLMYRKDVLAKPEVTMAAASHVAAGGVDRSHESTLPRWQGICLRGKPGWGDLGAAFTTVLNTFGGTWWSAKANGRPDKAQVDQPAFKEALDFYAKLVQDAGEKDAANSSFNECLTSTRQERSPCGTTQRWRGPARGQGQRGEGQERVRLRPGDKTKASGWLWTWALAIPKSSPDPTDAWTYIAWATGPQYLKAAGSRVKAAGRRSRRERASRPIRSPVQGSRESVRPDHARRDEGCADQQPGNDQAPGSAGVQYVGIPQFQDVGNRCTQLFASVIAARRATRAR